MTQTIEQLTARVRELEEENVRLEAAVEYAETIRVENIAYFEKQLAAEQLNNKRLRDALEFFFHDWKTYDHLSWKYKAKEALSTLISTEALDAYVAEKVKEAGKFDVWKTNPYTKVLETSIEQLTKQRDLAVEALEDVRKELQQSNDRLNEEREIWDRVMGDGVKKLERLELELDDCLYVLESLWDKTCNKEVTEKWAEILTRNKRVTGASSAEDSSEPTSSE